MDISNSAPFRLYLPFSVQKTIYQQTYPKRTRLLHGFQCDVTLSPKKVERSGGYKIVSVACL